MASNINHDSELDEEGRQLELLKVHWASTGDFVGLNEEGEVVWNEATGERCSAVEGVVDRYERLDLPSVIDNWTDNITCSISWKSGGKY